MGDASKAAPAGAAGGSEHAKKVERIRQAAAERPGAKARIGERMAALERWHEREGGDYSKARAERVAGLLRFMVALTLTQGLTGWARYFVETMGRMFAALIADQPHPQEALRAVFEARWLAPDKDDSNSGAVALTRRAARALALALSGELRESAEVLPLGSDVRDPGHRDWSMVAPCGTGGCRLCEPGAWARLELGDLTLPNIFDADEGEVWFQATKLAARAHWNGVEPDKLDDVLRGDS